MKTIQELENELRTWTPRRPSARLRARIFGSPAAEPGWGWSQTRLAFASAVGLALLIAIRQNPPAVSAGDNASPAMLAAALSNQTLAAYVSPGANQEWNPPAASFEYTNLGATPAQPKQGR